MKNIYKREPLVRSLPTGYAEMDAVNYKNLSGFKGLQIYDNPLVADANSTYSCKNVYVDEHGNLTVRPALMTTENLETTVLWRYEYSDGTVLRTEYAEGSYKLVVTNAEISNSIDFAEEPTIIPVEANGKYLFIKHETNHLYKLSEELEFLDTTGVKLLKDLSSQDITHYNILNDKVLTEMEYDNGAKIEAFDSITQYTTKFEPDYTIGVFNDEKLILANIGWKSINIYMLTQTGSYWQSAEILAETWDRLAKTRFALVLDEAGLNFRLKLTTTDQENSVRYLEFDISANGVCNKLYDITQEYEGINAATPVKNGFYVITATKLIITTLGTVISSVTKDLPDDWPAVSDLFPSFKYSDSAHALGTVKEYVGSLGRHLKIYYITADSYEVLTVLRYPLETENDSDYSASSAGTAIRTFESLDTTIIPSYISRVCVISDKVSTFSSSKRAENVENLYDMLRYSMNRDSYSIKTDDGIAVFYSNGESYIYSNSELSIDNYLGLDFAVNVSSESANSLTLHKLAVPLKQVDILRPTDVIPVLSDISEEPVTGFFLDNCHWFITEHSVFGTGFDGNGIATVERFDPLKYFKFSEKITGAIRLSDTSFWVFHNDGAYLIYKTTLTILNQTEYRWLCTATAKSKGCDFTNALVTLPVTSYIATVTNSDICTIQMRENIQSDERSLVPITMSIASDIRRLLSETESIKIVNYKYLTIFVLNKIDEDNITPAVVLDNATNSWWYWEFPVRYISQAWQTETDTYFLCPHEGIIVSLNSEEYKYSIGSIDYAIYADRLDSSQTPTQIEWGWQSAMQVFDTVERRKQLLFTTFVFDDFMPTDDSEQTIELGYYFNIYSKNYATSKPDATTATVFRVSNTANKTIISSFNYLQLVLCNMDFDAENMNFEVLTKPKICCISLKYRLLRGEWT